MSKNQVKYCKNCKSQTKHSNSMSGECLNCSFSEDDILEEDEDFDLEWIDEDYESRKTQPKIR